MRVAKSAFDNSAAFIKTSLSIVGKFNSASMNSAKSLIHSTF